MTNEEKRAQEKIIKRLQFGATNIYWSYYLQLPLILHLN